MPKLQLPKLPMLPSREALLAKRWLRPFAHWFGAPVLWHWNRRGVARGLALGLFVGILIPLVQSPFAAALSLVVRGNLPIAVLATFITNPLTTPAVLYAGYRVGDLILQSERRNAVVDMQGTLGWIEHALNWLTVASLPTALGLLVMASIAGTAGYFGTHLWWRWRVGRRWQARRRRAMTAA